MFETDAAADALLTLLARLDGQGYQFVPPTPATHARVLRRPNMDEASDLRGIFGWSLPFREAVLPPDLLDLLERAGMLRREGALFKSGVRVARIHGQLFLHSPFPTDAEDAVFFGPDSYRFVDFVRAELAPVRHVERLVDLGAGSGVGGIMAAPFVPGARIALLDRNGAALRLAEINARHAGVEVDAVEGDGIEDVGGTINLVIANPPYMIDESGRTYRDGGDMHGARISFDWTCAVARRLAPGGRVLLYTGSAIVNGRDQLKDELQDALPDFGCTLRYRELDPDVFGEDLDMPAYADVERIAVVGAVIEKWA